MPNSIPRKCFHVFRSSPGRCIRWGLVAVGLTVSAQARAEYRLNVGDVLEVAVTGVPELRQCAPAQIDGNISLPLVGMLPVAGLPLSDLEYPQKTTDLYSKGSLISPRVMDAHRAVLLSSTRKLRTSAQLLQVKTQQDEFVRKLAKLDDQRRLDLLRELQKTSVKPNQIRDKLQSVSEKLPYTGIVRSPLARGNADKAEIVILRMGDNGQEPIVASEDTELQPGDAVEVSLGYQDSPDAAPRKPSSSNAAPAIGRNV